MTSARISPSFKNIAAGIAGLLLALCCFFAAAPAAHATTPPCSNCAYTNGLTENQISALLNLLSSFGADQATINNVGNILRGGSPSCDNDHCSDSAVTFSASPTSGAAPLSVYFQGSGSALTKGAYISFGDETKSGYGQVSVSHTYSNPGTYTAQLHKDGAKAKTVASKTITVSSAAGLSCTVSASPSTIARNSGNVLGITWSSQNAVSRTYKGYTPAGNVYYSSPQIAVSGTLQDTSFNNLAPGTYTRIDTVVGANGATATCSASLTVTADNNTSTTFSATPTSGAAPLTVAFRSSGNTYSNPQSIEFGDGASSLACSGLECEKSVSLVQHTYTQAGTYRAILREPLDGQVVGTQAITVSSAAPSCTVTPSPSTVGVGGKLVVDWSAQNATSRTYTVRNPSGTVIYTSPAIPTSGRLDNTYFDNLLSTPGTYTRTDTVTGPGGTATCQAQLLVTASAAPACSVAYSPSTIARNAGQTLGITWSATNATSRSYVGINSLGNIFTGPHTISPSGSLQDTSFNNLAPGTYTRVDTVAGPGGNGNCYQTLTVTGPAAYDDRSSSMAAAAAIPLSMSADSINILADQITEVNYAIAGVLSSYVALFSPDAPQAAAAASAQAPADMVAGESLAATLAYMPQSLYETVGKTTDFLAAVEMAPVYVISDALSEALFKAGIY